jgi:hypothetical protein
VESDESKISIEDVELLALLGSTLRFQEGICIMELVNFCSPPLPLFLGGGGGLVNVSMKLRYGMLHIESRCTVMSILYVMLGSLNASQSTFIQTE